MRLRELAVNWAGCRPTIAWLWPLSIDLSIAVSTLAPLALTGAPRRTDVAPTQRNGAPVAHNGVPLHKLDAQLTHWSAVADELIGAGVTRIDRDRVAAVLAELADGTAPSTARIGELLDERAASFE